LYHKVHAITADAQVSCVLHAQWNLPKEVMLRNSAMRYLVICACLLSVTAAHAAPPIDLNDFRGRVVYLDFWASWCAPCLQSFPWMQAMQDTYQRKGLTVLAVNLDQYRKDADRFLAKFHPNFDVRFDPRGEMAERFKIQGMPTGVIIDRHGVRRFTHIGFRPVDQAAYEDQLRQVLAEQ
jgi:cytochrome c biogenesis protein CcmG/thiol:disulfide interchange protein DsbE